MLKKIAVIAALVVPALLGSPAMAACPPSLHTFINGYTADAVQVNDNFTNTLNCLNTLAPTAGPSFTGAASFAGAVSFASTANFASTVYFAGNVGIGTTSPVYPLVISNGGHEGVEIAPGSGGGIDSLQFYNRAASSYDAATFIAGSFRFAISGTEKFRIDTTGNVGIGTVSPGYPLDVVGDIRTSTCLRYNGGGTPGGSCMSDILLKRDIAPFTLGLQSVVGLKPVNFYYNGLGGNPDDGIQQLGLIAQDVEKVAPQLVGTRLVKLHPSDTKLTPVKTVNYGALTAMLINAVKELKASNDRYAAQLAALQSRVAALEHRTGVRTAGLAAPAAR